MRKSFYQKTWFKNIIIIGIPAIISVAGGVIGIIANSVLKASLVVFIIFALIFNLIIRSLELTQVHNISGSKSYNFT